MEKGRQLAGALTCWQKKHFKNWRYRIKGAQDKLQRLEKLKPSQWSIHEESRMTELIGHMMESERRRWRQLSCIKWNLEGEKNTKFFHLYAMNRRRKNWITWIKKSDGEITENPQDIEDVIIGYFKAAFKTEGSRPLPTSFVLQGPVLTNRDIQYLNHIPDPGTIYQTLKQLSSLKAPGPDSYPGIFYQRHWDVLKDDTVAMVRNFFSTYHLPLGINHTHIALITKKEICNYPSDYRPISLTNTLYKIITKIIATRLRRYLPDCISSSQAAFVKERNIEDNIIMARGIQVEFNKSKTLRNYFRLKIDLSKAFDRVEWRALEEILLQFNFPRIFVKWIMTCIQSPTFSILINGKASQTFHSSRGIRQGCPLSPFLFTLVMEVLSRILQQLEMAKYIRGFQFQNGGMCISHLFYADDLLIYGTASRYEAMAIRYALGIFCDYTGQKINFDKSTITFNRRCKPEEQNEIKEILGINKSDLEGIYLGTTVQVGKKLEESHKGIIEKTRRQLSKWKGKFLSHAGREVLTKSTLAAQPIYAMTTSLISKKNCKILDNIQRDFWWGFTQGERHLYLLGWKQMQRTKDRGGLDFKSTEILNKVMIGKLAWEFVNNPDTPWVRCFREKYCPDVAQFWSIQPRSSDSMQWKSILKIKNIITENGIWAICNGKKINIFTKSGSREEKNCLLHLLTQNLGT